MTIAHPVADFLLGIICLLAGGMFGLYIGFQNGWRAGISQARMTINKAGGMFLETRERNILSKLLQMFEEEMCR